MTSIGLFLPAFFFLFKKQCFYQIFCLMNSICFLSPSQSNFDVSHFIARETGFQRFPLAPYVFNGAGNKLWCSKSFSSPQLSDKISLSVICFGLLVLTQWLNAESMEFRTMGQTALEWKAIIWHFTYCMLLTGHWHLQHPARGRKPDYLNGVYRRFSKPYLLTKAFINGNSSSRYLSLILNSTRA